MLHAAILECHIFQRRGQVIILSTVGCTCLLTSCAKRTSRPCRYCHMKSERKTVHLKCRPTGEAEAENVCVMMGQKHANQARVEWNATRLALFPWHTTQKQGERKRMKRTSSMLHVNRMRSWATSSGGGSSSRQGCIIVAKSVRTTKTQNMDAHPWARSEQGSM